MFISEGYTLAKHRHQNYLDPDITRSRAMRDSIEISLQDATRAATLNDVTIYTVDPRGMLANAGRGDILTSDETIMQAIEDARSVQSMRDVAALTGGTAIVNTNNIAAGLQRMVVENSSYYILAFTPTPLPRDGKLHNWTCGSSRRASTSSRGEGIAASSAPRRCRTRRVECRWPPMMRCAVPSDGRIEHAGVRRRVPEGRVEYEGRVGADRDRVAGPRTESGEQRAASNCSSRSSTTPGR